MAAAASWYRGAYRRAVIDMHIPDWDDRFLARFDAAQYAARLVEARAQSVVAYGQSHAGLFNYPTKVGRQHAAQKGRNVLGEIVAACHDKGLAVVVYTSLVFDRWCADNHPEWRMVLHDGKPFGEGARQRVLCINSPYREYVRAFVDEICTNFDVEGLRFDMTFWPGYCYCPHCTRRFADEVGGALPRTVDWFDPKWVAFQRRREAWLVEFADVATSTVRQRKPSASVEHQASTYPLGPSFGVTDALTTRNDFLQGDFYGDALQGSFVRKLLEDLTPHRPFGYETSVKLELKNHTALKSEPLLEAKASAALADSAAFIFIDGIDPGGAIDPRPYARMGRVFGRLMPYYDHLGGARVRDVAIYYSLVSKFNPSAGRKDVAQFDNTDAHTTAAMQAARRLIGAHLPFGVVTRHSLSQLDGVKVLVLPGVIVMNDEELATLRAWVRGGGALYASGGTSLCDEAGRLRDDFGLADVFGVALKHADWRPRVHYAAPTAAGRAHFGEFDEVYPAFLTGYGLEVSARPGASVLATTTLPWPAPDPSRFSSIHSDPPWQPTDRPEVVLNRFGKGRAVYTSSVLETVPELATTFLSLVRALHPSGWRFEAEAPECVEVTLFHQPERHRYVLSLVNFQPNLPNIPVDGIQVVLRLDGGRVRAVRELRDGKAVAFEQAGDSVHLTAPRLETLAMFAIEIG